MIQLAQTPVFAEAMERILTIAAKNYFRNSAFTARWRWRGDDNSTPYLKENTPQGEQTTDLHIVRKFPSLADVSGGNALFPCITISTGVPVISALGLGGYGPLRGNDTYGDTLPFGARNDFDVVFAVSSIGESARRAIEEITSLLVWGLQMPGEKDHYSVYYTMQKFGVELDRYNPKPGNIATATKYFGIERLYTMESHVKATYEYSEDLYVQVYGVVLALNGHNYWYAPQALLARTPWAYIWQEGAWVEVTDAATLEALRVAYLAGRADGTLGVSTIEGIALEMVQEAT